MPKSTRAPSGAQPSHGIFSAQWHQFRGATLRVELDGEEPFIARLDNVGSPNPTARKTASLTVLDDQGQPTAVRQVEWPPRGSVRVVRAP